MVQARPQDLGRYIEMLEEIAVWLESRQIRQWQSGMFQQFESYFADSIRKGEAHFAYHGDDLVGTIRLLPSDTDVWPEATENDSIYVYNIAVGRKWAGHRIGRQMLDWAGRQAASLGRNHLRLDCLADNGFLCRYYSDAGFEDRGAVDATYPEPIGTLRLRRFEKGTRES